MHSASKATAHLWIEEPLDKESNKGHTKWNHLFDTHPPIDDRIHALEADVSGNGDRDDMRVACRRSVAVRVVVVVARGRVRRRRQARGRTSRPRATTARQAAPAVAPLTGLPDPTGAAGKRCAVTVKIDNTQRGHPKYGVDQADVVYEEVVEGGITRLAAIFNSHAPDRVGPVRSVRKTDQSIVMADRRRLRLLGRRAVRDRRRSTPRPWCSSTRTRAGPLMFRDHSRDAPLEPVRARRPACTRECKDPAPPPRCSRTARRSTASRARPCRRCASVSSAGFAVTWTWDAPSGTWKRSIFGEPEITSRRARSSRRRTSS